MLFMIDSYREAGKFGLQTDYMVYICGRMCVFVCVCVAVFQRVIGISDRAQRDIVVVMMSCIA